MRKHFSFYYRRSEFLGCVSFPLKDAIKGDISGTYFLQSQVSGRNQGAYTATPASDQQGDRCLKETADYGRVTGKGEGRRKMATDNMEGTSTNDEGSKENHNDRGEKTEYVTKTVPFISIIIS